MYRIGNGFDAHRFAAGRKLILGGIQIPYEFGLRGYSDADVLTHSICDALLGAVGSGDLGKHFPSSDPRFKDICSLELLKMSYEEVKSNGFKIENIDTIIICEKPRLSKYIEKISNSISKSIGVSDSIISIKATTTDGMGFIGRAEGIASYATVLLRKVDETLSYKK
jgi:2-C-methyl-D-erythritol 2,4-cyclodiphosphate synthase